MSGMYPLSSDIPVPPEGTRRYKYPFLQMQVGDSFCVPVSEMNRVRCSAREYGIRHKVKFTTRKIFKEENAAIRVWRVE